MRLQTLLTNIASLSQKEDCEIHGLSQDSRTIQSGDLFFCVKGYQTEGIYYLASAIQKGAAALLIDDTFTNLPALDSHCIPILRIKDLRRHISTIAARFYHHPNRHIRLIGITGTNGKSTCTHWIASAVAAAGKPCGIIGTLGYGFYEPTNEGPSLTILKKEGLTTPNTIEIQQLLATFRDRGIQTVALEVSSHALAQERLGNVNFFMVGLTNLTHDHLDYHLTFKDYLETKQKLFTQYASQHIILNQDDVYGKQWLNTWRHTAPSIYGYTVEPSTQIDHKPLICEAVSIKSDLFSLDAHLKTPWGRGDFTNANLVGIFNLSNLLLVFITLHLLGLPFTQILHWIAQVRPITGRMEKISQPPKTATIFIDYAHTPDALEKALQAIKLRVGQLWCIFGCGGDRDPEKRPLMGKIAEQYADQVIVTEDNPRTECSETIIHSILSGMQSPQKAHIIFDRKQAIQWTLRHAKVEDIVLIAGKGHETTQVIQKVAYPFSDHQVVKDILQGKSKHSINKE